MTEKCPNSWELRWFYTRWCFACPSGHGRNTNKCNYLVEDVWREAGAKISVHTFSLRGGPVGVGIGWWGTASLLSYWSRVSSPQRGDIVSAHRRGTYHMGIYFARCRAASANDQNVGRNSWPWGAAYPGYSVIVLLTLFGLILIVKTNYKKDF